MINVTAVNITKDFYNYRPISQFKWIEDSSRHTGLTDLHCSVVYLHWVPTLSQKKQKQQQLIAALIETAEGKG